MKQPRLSFPDIDPDQQALRRAALEQINPETGLYVDYLNKIYFWNRPDMIYRALCEMRGGNKVLLCQALAAYVNYFEHVESVLGHDLGSWKNEDIKPYLILVDDLCKTKFLILNATLED